MPRPRSPINALPSWIYLFAGLAMLAAALLVPAWIDVEDLGWQRDTMQAQLAALQTQRDHYAAYLQARERNDPAVLQRLARAVFHQNAADQSPLHPIHALNPDTLDTPDAWLAAQLPQVGSDLPEPPAYRSMLVRLTTGKHQAGIVLVAGIFIFVGLWRGTPETPVRDLSERVRLAAEDAWDTQEDTDDESV